MKNSDRVILEVKNNEIRLAGFRIREELWIKFKAICILKHPAPEKELAPYIEKQVGDSNLLSKPSFLMKLKEMLE